MSIHIDRIEQYLIDERADHARVARSYGLIVFNPDTDPDTCAMVAGLSDERLHAEEDERMRDFTVEHFAEITERSLDAGYDRYAYDRDGF